MSIVEGKGTYKVLIGGQVKTYSNWKDLPQEFDNIVLFQPDWLEGPHTEEVHKYHDSFNDVFQKLMKREKK